MASVTYERATRVYPRAERPAVAELDLHVDDGEFLVLVGPSGCGKSTSLRMAAGLEDVDEGAIRIGERDVTDVPPKDRDVAMVFQNYALYPHMTVAENMGFALKISGVKKKEIKTRVAEAARILDLEEYLGRRPRQLSGGQRQRVAMGRAIVRAPKVFLMDEPLSNLDAKLRVQTRAQIATLQRRLEVTTVYVTHDQVEAMTMGDRVAVMDKGHLQQIDKPRELFAKPANVFVAGFVGSPQMNLHEVAIADGQAELAGYRIPLPRAVTDAKVVLGFRPEALEVVATEDAGIPVTVTVVEELGADAFLYGRLPGSSDNLVRAADIVARIDPKNVPATGDLVRLAIRPDQLHIFSAATGQRLT
ncbi:MAG TPA: sn-glycerol-3-phosphate ABC transporter ATP-binding protein UgpC [Gaiellaceae bacterium]|nr:sn-glycerol-3-phosphate ABC transporter ATP-binding protein UgpC [Gaiellaceae bacterium]